MKFTLQVWEDAVCLSSFQRIDLHQLTEIVDGFHHSSHLQTLLQRKAHLEFLLRQNEEFINQAIDLQDGLQEVREMKPFLDSLSSDYIEENEIDCDLDYDDYVPREEEEIDRYMRDNDCFPY